MDIDEFISTLEKQLSKLDFVENWKIDKKSTTLRVRVNLQRKSILNVFYNMVLRIQSFALIINEKRVWGIDRDNRFGWHEHTLQNPEIHKSIESCNIEQIIKQLEFVWNQIDKSK